MLHVEAASWIPQYARNSTDVRQHDRRSMALHPAYAQVSALLIAVFILIAGNGLSNTLIPLSATAARFPPLSIGVIASAYFAGMFVGCIAAPRIIARAGHIRAFSAFVAIATASTLLHPMFVDPVAWAAIRAVTG